MELFMVWLQFLHLICLITGDKYCRMDNITCSPCSQICEDNDESCHSKKRYCPSNCKDMNNCRYECCEDCMNDACILTDEVQLKCSEGCKQGRTGICCREWCPSGCLTCDQFNNWCTSCQDGKTGDFCERSSKTTLETTSVAPTIFSQNSSAFRQLTTTFPEIWPTADNNLLSTGLGTTVRYLISGLFVLPVIAIFSYLFFVVLRTYRIECACKCRRNRGNRGQADGTVTVEHTYDYVAYYSGLRGGNQEAAGGYGVMEDQGQGPPVSGYVESVVPAFEDISIHSVSSDTLFGNLFDLPGESYVDCKSLGPWTPVLEEISIHSVSSDTLFGNLFDLPGESYVDCKSLVPRTSGNYITPVHDIDV